MLDLLSEGRVTTILGLGYRPEEYEMFDAPWETRGAYFDEWLQALLDAWRGEPFTYQDRKVLPVTPRPLTPPHPPIFVGGRSKAAARRAARFGLNFFPDSSDPALREAYEAACRDAGREPGLMITPEDPVTFVFVHDDPDGYWERIGPHVLHEAMTYSGWQPDGETSSASTDASHHRGAEGGRPLRRSHPRRGRRARPPRQPAPVPAVRGHPTRDGVGVAAPRRARGPPEGTPAAMSGVSRSAGRIEARKAMSRQAKSPQL